jgi:hypothetical protein
VIENGEISFGYGHVWFGENANRNIFDPTDVKQANVETSGRLHTKPQLICLRFYMRGGASQFGMLGCQFIPEDTENTIIKVSFRDQNDETRPPIGLSEELAEVVLKEAIAVLNQEDFLGSGTLYFDRGMYHIVDSTPWVFKVLTKAILSFLNPQMQFTKEEEVNMLFEKLVKERSP